MVLHLPHTEDGLRVTFNDVTQDSASPLGALPFLDLKLMFTNSSHTDQLSLHSQQHIVATVEDSTPDGDSRSL